MRRLSLWPMLMLAAPRFRDALPWVIPPHLCRELAPRAPRPLYRSLYPALPYFTGSWERERVELSACLIELDRITRAAMRLSRPMNVPAREAWPVSAMIADYWQLPLARASDRDATVPPFGAPTADES